MNVVLVQLDLAWEDPEANFRKARKLLDAATGLQGALIVLPEMFATGFSMNVETVIFGEPARTATELAEFARKYRATVIGGFGTAGSGDKGINSALVVDSHGHRIAEYAKIHPFSPAGESDLYERGSSVTTFQWAGMAVCPFICYDLRFPEIFRAGVRQGAEVFCVIANWPIHRVAHWVTLLQARAIENQAYVVGVNRCGADPNFTYPGRSLVVDPHGTILVDAGDRETIVSRELDPVVVRDWRRDFPALKDMHYSESF